MTNSNAGSRPWPASPGLTRRATVALAGLMLVPASPALAATPASRFAGARSGRLTLDHGAFSGLLAKRSLLRAGVVRVDYGGWRASIADRAALKAYIAKLAVVDPAKLTRPEQFAFWANLYNAVTIETVLAAYPVRSIRDIRPSPLSIGPWKTRAVTVDGVGLSLDDIENGILRAGWRDPRVHYAINCASIGCPNLPRIAWSGERLDVGLESAARAYVNHPRGVHFEGDKLVVSSIYKWFSADFGGRDRAIIDHLSTFAQPALKARLRSVDQIGGDEYDWTLNGVRPS